MHAKVRECTSYTFSGLLDAVVRVGGCRCHSRDGHLPFLDASRRDRLQMLVIALGYVPGAGFAPVLLVVGLACRISGGKP